MDAVGLPLRHGAPDEFARVRSLCGEAGFTEDGICRALGLDSIADLTKVGPTERNLTGVEPQGLSVMIRLFLLGKPVPEEQVRQAVGPAGQGALERLDLIRPHQDDGFLATVAFYPVAGLLLASDRFFNPDGTPYRPPSDLVFAAISPLTMQFLRVISRAPARAVLDLCTGSGAAGLLLSRTADLTTAVDITARSVHFARFNALLNACENVEVLQGDLYRDLGGRRFDRIVAHPPYVPALADPQIWRDGGETGEAVLRGIIEGLPVHLAPGGSFFAVTMGLDVGSHSFEERIRSWLGEAQPEFDLIYAVDREWTPRKLAADLAVRSRHGETAVIARWEEHLKDLGVRRAYFGALALRRREGGSATHPLTLRTRLSEATNGDAFDRTFWRHDWISSPAAGPEVAAAAPRLSPHLQVKITHAVSDGELAPQEFLLETTWPFQATSRVEPWVISVIAHCDGRRTTSDLYREAKADGALPDEFGLSNFAGLVATLVVKGFLQMD